ncbi:MAG: triose-phosphate isomerase [Alphaproteobacteria bacterium]|nr:triose-phosphate isomerase [Alphaproteobacteria bacterium]
MNGLQADGLDRVRRVAALRAATEVPCDLLVCPPATLLAAISEALAGSPIATGGQDCAPQTDGAYTGDIAARMLKDAGARYVILGHSERRHGHGESDAQIRAKSEAALAAGLMAIICVGETLAERDGGQTLAVLSTQVKASVPPNATAVNTVIAYEPVWAIGTGRNAAPPQIAEAHAHIRATLRQGLGAEADRMRILYGGSVKPANARETLALADVDGALVGGASLDVDAFWAIAQACPKL